MSFLRAWFPERAVAASLPPGTLPRVSQALAQFFQSLAERNHPTVLDLGRVWHSTVTLLTEAGAKVYAEDVLDALDGAVAAPEALSATRFFETHLRYDEASLDAILAWDLFEYLPEEFLLPIETRLHAALKPRGLLLALFRNRLEPDGGSRYRLLTPGSFAIMPGGLGIRQRRLLHNRAVLNLFAGFSSSRTFIGRDNLREVLLVK